MTTLTRSQRRVFWKKYPEIFKYKAYPTDNDFSDVAKALVKRHLCLCKRKLFNGCYGQKQRLKTEMDNYWNQFKDIGCCKLLAYSLNSKARDDNLIANNVKRLRRGRVQTNVLTSRRDHRNIWRPAEWSAETVPVNRAKENKVTQLHTVWVCCLSVNFKILDLSNKYMWTVVANFLANVPTWAIVKMWGKGQSDTEG